MGLASTSCVGKCSSLNMWWDLIAEARWDKFHRTTSDPLYTCLIWNATLRRVL